MVATAEYGRDRSSIQGRELEARKKSYKKQAKEIYEDSLKLTNEEQERLKLGLMRYTVTGEILPFPGDERFLFRRLMELRELWDSCETEDGSTSTATQQASHVENETCDACHDNDNNNIIYNNIIYNNNINKLKEKITISLKDHDNDHMEREASEKEDRTPALSDGPGQTPEEGAQGSALDRVTAAVETLCEMTCYDYVRQEIGTFIELLGEELCLLAVKRAERYAGKTWGYIRRIMEDWYRNGIHTSEEATEYCSRFDQTRRAAKHRGPGPSGKNHGTGRRQYNRPNDCSMYQHHKQTTLSPLEREAIEAALREE